ncbi:MAG: pentapeptide repeat-containing protein [Polyangiaceae bacterium]
MRKPVTKPLRAPELPADVAPTKLGTLRSGEVVEAARIVGDTLDASKAANVSLVDVVLEKTSLGMLDWRGASLTRVVFAGCRITGGKLAEATLEDVRFVGCQLDYASFYRSRFARATFEGCQLREADFTGSDLRGVLFGECELERAIFTEAKLEGTDVSSSRIGSIVVRSTDVRGLVVSGDQASVLATVFGLVVR